MSLQSVGTWSFLSLPASLSLSHTDRHTNTVTHSDSHASFLLFPHLHKLALCLQFTSGVALYTTCGVRPGPEADELMLSLYDMRKALIAYLPNFTNYHLAVKVVSYVILIVSFGMGFHPNLLYVWTSCNNLHGV